MSPPENKLIVQRFMQEAWNQRNFAVVEEIIAPDHVVHDASGPDLGTGPEAYINRMKLYVGALDFQFKPEDMIAEGDRVVVRWTAHGRNNLNLTGITIHRFQDGKIVESWANWDQLGMMQHLREVRSSQQTSQSA
jgi:predicted ester cyclase